MQRKLNGDFIKDYSGQFSEIVTSGFFEDRDVISGKEILRITPSKQVNLFILKLLFRKWQEEMKRLESPYFNYRHPEVRKAMVQFMNTLSQHIEVDGDHFISMMEEALAETFRLASSPDEFLIEEFRSLGVDRVNEKLTRPIMKYIKIHKSEIESFFEKEQDLALPDFEEAIRTHFQSMDLEVAVRDLVSELSEILEIAENQIFDSNHVSEADEEEDKEFKLADDEEDAEDYPDAGKEYIEVDQTREGEEDESHSEEEEDPILEDSAVNEEEGIGTDGKEEDREVLNAGEVEFPESKREDESMDESGTPQATVHDQFSTKTEILADKLHQTTPVGTLMEAISVNHRYMFTKELFEGDRERFESTMGSLEACNSFDDAVEKLVQEHAKPIGWDMNSDEVKELLKVIFRRFR